MQASDSQLTAYLALCDPVELHTVIAMMRSKLSAKSKELARRYPTPESIPPAGSKDRQALARVTVNLLRWFGSNTIGYGLRRLMKQHGGASYHRIVADVARHINLKHGQRGSLPRMATVTEWEEIVVRSLLVGAVQGKSAEEVAQMLHEAGLKMDAARATAMKLGTGATGVALPLLLTGLGRKVAGTLLEQVMVGLALRYIGKDAVQVVAKRMAVEAVAGSWSRLIGLLGGPSWGSTC